MTESEIKINAEVIAVLPNKVRISINNLDDFKTAEEKLSVGSYLRISDSEDCAIISIIDNFIIDTSTGQRKYLIESVPLGFLDSDNKFHRGGNNIAIPPIGVKPAKESEIQSIYSQIEKKKQFCFSKLAHNEKIKIPVDGDRFFNKHIAIVGSTGSGKSHAVSKILQEVVEQKESVFEGLNNSHIILFDIHGEYKSAFPKANSLDVENLFLPYWLMNGEELEELFVESGDFQAYNQVSLLRRLVTQNKQLHNAEFPRVTFDSPILFSMNEVLQCLENLSRETRNAKNNSEIAIKSGVKTFNNDEDKFKHYFQNSCEFEEIKAQSINKGIYNDGSLEKFISRIKNKLNDKRLDFLLGERIKDKSFKETIFQFLSYQENKKANISIIDLSGVPFEVLSITVSFISRIIFDYGYYYKRMNLKTDTPLLVIYEEAHRYVPKINLAKYNSSRFAIERISKEGRKYGVTLVIVSQRPSEISETIFSQCNNFIIMRLTNPEDQNYVKRLLPDNLGPITDTLPVLEAGQSLLIGDSVIMPCLVKIDKCYPEPSSNDIDYIKEWKKPWFNVEFEKLIEIWKK